MKQRWGLGPGQMWVWVVTSYSGLGYFAFPRILYASAGSSAFYALLLGIAASFLSVQLNGMAASLVPGRSLAHLAKEVFGRWGGIAFELVPFAHQLVILSVSLRLLGDIIHTSALFTTPPGALILCTSAVVLYVAATGVEPATRMFQFWVPGLLALVMITLIVTISNFDPVMARPHFVSLEAVWSGFANHFYMYGGIATISIVLAFTDVRKAMPWLHAGVAVNSVSLLVPFFTVASTLGPFVAMDLQWPVISAMRLADLPGFIVERFGWLVVLAYTMYMVMFQAGITLLAGIGMTHLFDLPQEHYRRFLLPAVGLAAGGAIFLIPDPIAVEALLTGVLMYTSFFIAIVKPTVLYLGGRMRGLRPGVTV